VVLEGEIWLEVDDHQTVHLRRGDIVAQNGTRHGWRNKGSQSATMLFVLHGANQ
jgi:quercetin dioxygenase-like cupin family protein